MTASYEPIVLVDTDFHAEDRYDELLRDIISSFGIPAATYLGTPQEEANPISAIWQRSSCDPENKRRCR